MSLRVYFFFFFNDTATTEIYTLSLHDALPILVEMEREAQTKARREVLEMFLDLRDRMVRGLETARKSLVRLEGLSPRDRKSTRLNSSHSQISYAVFCLKKKK